MYRKTIHRRFRRNSNSHNDLLEIRVSTFSANPPRTSNRKLCNIIIIKLSEKFLPTDNFLATFFELIVSFVSFLTYLQYFFRFLRLILKKLSGNDVNREIIIIIIRKYVNKCEINVLFTQRRQSDFSTRTCRSVGVCFRIFKLKKKKK